MNKLPTIPCGVLAALIISASHAGNVSVSPGLDTLQNAVGGAQPGDVLLLDNGTYTDSDSLVFVNTSVTIRAASAAATPVLELDIQGRTNGIDIIFQGLEFHGNVNPGNGSVTTGTVAFLENTFVNTAVTKGATGSVDRLLMFGNEFLSSVDLAGALTIDLNANEMSYFAGNRVQVDPGGRLQIEAFGSGFLHVVGNEFTGGIYRNDEMLDATMVAAQIIGNRFQARLDVDAGSSTGFFPQIIQIQGSGNNLIMNNLFLLTDASAIPSGTTNVTGLNAVLVFNSAPSTEIRNNVIDFGGFMFDTSSFSGEGPIFGPGKVEGNIFLNVTRGPLVFTNGTEAGNTFANNMCFMTVDPCGTGDGNQDADPLFVDTMDYRLQGTSPGIDAGPDFAFLVDLDGTQADVGLYGGPFPIDQYDAQRNDTSTAPFIYPVFNASRSVNVLGDLPIDVIGIARIR